jgi:hypothetical protein
LPVPTATLSEDSKKIIFTGLDSRDDGRMYQVYLTWITDNNNNPLYGSEPLFKKDSNAIQFNIIAYGQVHYLKFVPMEGIHNISEKTYPAFLPVEKLKFDGVVVDASWIPKNLIKSNRMTSSEHCGKKHWNWEKAKYERHCSTSYTTYSDYFGNLRLNFKGLPNTLVGATGGTYYISGKAILPGGSGEDDIELSLPNKTYSITFDEQKSGFFLDIDFGLPHPVSSSVVAPKHGYMYLGYTNTNGDTKYYIGQGSLKFKFYFTGSNKVEAYEDIDISIPRPF